MFEKSIVCAIRVLSTRLATQPFGSVNVFLLKAASNQNSTCPRGAEDAIFLLAEVCFHLFPPSNRQKSSPDITTETGISEMHASAHALHGSSAKQTPKPRHQPVRHITIRPAPSPRRRLGISGKQGSPCLSHLISAWFARPESIEKRAGRGKKKLETCKSVGCQKGAYAWPLDLLGSVRERISKQ